jgi:hypothetical protein
MVGSIYSGKRKIINKFNSFSRKETKNIMKINIIKNIASILIVGALVIPALVSAQEIPAATGGNQTTAVPTATGGGQTTASATPLPTPTGGGQTTASATPAPTATGGGQTTASATPAPVATGGGQTTASGGSSSNNNNSGGTPPGGSGSTPTGSGNSSPSSHNVSVGSGGSGPSGSAMYSNAPCTVITTTMLVGGTYPVADVTKLQNFLKSEGLTVTVSGIFDEQTVAAVKAFQTKYAAEILAPWGVTTPTGNVYMTTLKKINSRACNSALTLSADELAQINAYKSRVAAGENNVEVVGTTHDSSNTVVATVDTTTTVDSGTSNSTSTDSQVAAVTKTSVWTKIWNFIKRVFGR